MTDERTTEIPAVLSYEKDYADGSGTEYRVTYQHKPYCHDGDIIGYVVLEHVGTIDIPVTQLDWYIEKLQEIKARL